jgi:hypothetical protein
LLAARSLQVLLSPRGLEILLTTRRLLLILPRAGQRTRSLNTLGGRALLVQELLRLPDFGRAGGRVHHRNEGEDDGHGHCGCEYSSHLVSSFWSSVLLLSTFATNHRSTATVSPRRCSV